MSVAGVTLRAAEARRERTFAAPVYPPDTACTATQHSSAASLTGDRRIADLAVDNGDAWVAIEVTTSMLTRESGAVFTYSNASGATGDETGAASPSVAAHALRASQVSYGRRGDAATANKSAAGPAMTPAVTAERHWPQRSPSMTQRGGRAAIWKFIDSTSSTQSGLIAASSCSSTPHSHRTSPIWCRA